MPPDRHEPPPLLGLLLRTLYQHHAHAVDKALDAAGFGDLRPPHANVFPFVPPEGIQVAELAARAGVRKQSMAQSVQELERMGYVERQPDPTDGRAKLVLLTSKGKAVRPVARRTGTEVERSWANLVGTDQIESLRGALQELLGAINTGYTEER